ncbi:MAG TPA: DUF3048 domain-containing protein [Mycobacteriales bacterium]|nr:DUF3048 domain-containing protein [Mycobacteriales bacterium]
MSRAKTLLPLGAVLLVAACGGSPTVSLQPASPASPVPTTAAATTAAAPSTAADTPLAPLTATPVSAAVAKRPAVVVSLPLSGAVGLDKADLVYQEYETPRGPRVVAVFQSRDATDIGPVGSVRPLDPQLLPMLRPVYANTGGASGVEELLAKARIAQVSSGSTTSTSTVLAAAPAGSLPPTQVLSYASTGDAFTTSLKRSASAVTLTAPGGAAETWTYSAAAKRWTRAGTPGVAVSNLIVQTVEYKAVRLRDPDRDAQSARVLGTGSCYAFSGTTYTPCTWIKRSVPGVTSYVDHASVPLRFAAGSTWVVLMPPGSQQVAT